MMAQWSKEANDRIQYIRQSLSAIRRSGAKSVNLSVTLSWFEFFMFVLDVNHISVGTYENGNRFLQTHGGEPASYRGMRVTVNTDEVPPDIPTGVGEAYIAGFACPDCGELVAAYSPTREGANLAAIMFGGRDPWE